MICVAPQRPLLRYFGGKWTLAPWIVSHFPEHQVYVEPFGGAASVLLRKPRCYAEVYNDLDGEIVNLFRVARDQPAELERAIRLTPFARAEFELSYQMSELPVEQARRTLVRSYMGFGSTLTRLTVGGRLMRTGFRTYTKKNRRSIPAHDWATWPEFLNQLSQRIQGVVIEQRAAVEVIRAHDGAKTLHYVDPPYAHGSRGRSDGYRFELSNSEHAELCEILLQVRGLVVLSGYACPLYDRLYRDWVSVDRPHHADGARDRTEVLWMNFEPAEPAAKGGRMNMTPLTPNDTRDRLQLVAKMVGWILPPGAGFVVLVFDLEHVREGQQYVANAVRPEVVQAMGKFISGPNIPATQATAAGTLTMIAPSAGPGEAGPALSTSQFPALDGAGLRHQEPGAGPVYEAGSASFHA